MFKLEKIKVYSYSIIMNDKEISTIELYNAFGSIVKYLYPHLRDIIQNLSLTKTMCFISAFKLHEEFRSKGLASKFLTELDEILKSKGYTSVSLSPFPFDTDENDINKQYELLLHLYSKAGYTTIATFNNPLGFIQEGIIMGKN